VKGFIPGRLEILGKHTDYAGGPSLVAALPRGFTVQSARTTDGAITISDASSGEQAEFTPAGDGSVHGWRRYARTVIRRLASNFPGAGLSATITFTSDLPQAAGMSSSSALVIAIAESLIACAQIEDTAAWQAAIVTREDRAAYFGCIENGSSFRQLAGSEGVGTHGGSEDHAAIILSQPGHLQQCAFAPLRSERFVAMPAGWTFVIATSGVTAVKTGAAMDRYNRLADPRAMIGARQDHFMAETSRVRQAADAFAAGDIARIGQLAAASQDEADRLLQNQVPQTRDLVALALERGAAAATSFGAGWGGSVWALVDATAAAAFLNAWLGAYRARHPGLAATAFIAWPGAGAEVSNYHLSR
jgi:galactokinase